MLQFLHEMQQFFSSMLPDILVTSANFVPFISFYRQVMADEFLRDRPDEQDASMNIRKLKSVLKIYSTCTRPYL